MYHKANGSSAPHPEDKEQVLSVNGPQSKVDKLTSSQLNTYTWSGGAASVLNATKRTDLTVSPINTER